MLCVPRGEQLRLQRRSAALDYPVTASLGITMALVGMIAGIHHGCEHYFRDDIDVVVSAKDFPRMLRGCGKHGFGLPATPANNEVKLLFGTVPIHLLSEGMPIENDTGAEALPPPS